MEKYVLGVTGSMGCGKSYACKKLVEIGKSRGIEASHIDFDLVRRTNGRPYTFLDDKVYESKGLVLVEWALLVEDEILDMVDRNVLLVTASRDSQIRRLTGGDLPMEEVIRRIDSQLTNEQKKAYILEYQSQKDQGEFYSFDTTHNPQDNEYVDLFNKIVGGRK